MRIVANDSPVAVESTATPFTLNDWANADNEHKAIRVMKNERKEFII